MTKMHFAGAAMTALVSLALAGCTPPQPAKSAVDASKIADAIKADATQHFADVNAHDAAKDAGHYAADGVFAFHGMPNEAGAAAVLAGAQKGFANSDLHLVMSDPTVDVAASGDLAVYRSTVVATFTDPKTKKPATSTNNYLAVYKQQADGSWKIEWAVVSDTPQAPAAATKG